MTYQAQSVVQRRYTLRKISGAAVPGVWSFRSSIGRRLRAARLARLRASGETGLS